MEFHEIFSGAVDGFGFIWMIGERILESLDEVQF
jgi:hypothetical protein